jgi:hypothetical protein
MMNKEDRDSQVAKSWMYGVILSIATLFFVGPFVYRWWNLPPAVQRENLDCIQLLRTAVSSENSQQVAGVKRLLDKRVADGMMPDVERSHFDTIIRLAQSNQWEEANAACMCFEAAQLNRRR